MRTEQQLPDVFELPDGGFFVIGKVVGEEMAPSAEESRSMGASIGADELAVILPRECMLHAAKQLAAEGLVV
ncbi:hypothetical protein ACWGQ5_55695 [Streptomyces sp. NPDC055722]